MSFEFFRKEIEILQLGTSPIKVFILFSFANIFLSHNLEETKGRLN